MTGLDTATVALRGLHVAALMTVFGGLVFRCFVMPGSGGRLAIWACWLALVCGAAWLTAVAAGMAGARDLLAALAALPAVASHTNFGGVLCVRLAILACVLLALHLRRRRQPRAVPGTSRPVIPGSGPGTTGNGSGASLDWAALIGGGAALALQPLAGHAGALADGTGDVMIPLEAAHLLAGAAWLGGLIPLLRGVWRLPVGEAAAMCERFTPIGLVAVGVIAVTALPMAATMIGSLPALLGTQYGHLALLKLGLFAAALTLACLNRSWLTPRLAGNRENAKALLIGSVAIETAVVAGVVFAAAALASSPPASHTQPVWPFPWRPSLAAWNEPELRPELIRAALAAASGATLLIVSLALRRARLLAAALALGLCVLAAGPSLTLLLVEAYPTSYARSPTGFSVASIVRGEDVFGQRCAGCHEPRSGTGDAADLTAAHVWGHSDGELFWWISHGIAGPAGEPRMPAFGPMLPENDIWALIDFVHARNTGAQAHAGGGWSPPVLAPDTPLTCDGEGTMPLADLGRHDLLLIADSPNGPSDEVPLMRVPGAETVRLPKGGADVPGEGSCVTASPAAWEAWRVLSGISPDRFGGYRAVIDSQGWLRAWLPPAADAAGIAAALRAADRDPIALTGRPAVEHRH